MGEHQYPPNFPMTRSEYLAHLARLVEALLRAHGPLSVRAVQEMANQLIVQHGIRDAHRFIVAPVSDGKTGGAP